MNVTNTTLTCHLTSGEGQKGNVCSTCGIARDGVGFAKALKPPQSLQLAVNLKDKHQVHKMPSAPGLLGYI